MLLSNWGFTHQNTLPMPLGNPGSVYDEAKDTDRISIDYQTSYFIVVLALALNVENIRKAIAITVDPILSKCMRSTEPARWETRDW